MISRLMFSLRKAADPQQEGWALEKQATSSGHFQNINFLSLVGVRMTGRMVYRSTRRGRFGRIGLGSRQYHFITKEICITITAID